MTKHNAWSISIIGILFALLFTPLIVAGSLYFPYVTGKVFAFRSLVTVAFVLWVVLVLKYPQFLPKKSWILASVGVFLTWIAIANVFGVDPENSFLSNFERMEGWFTHFYFFLLLVIASSVMQGEKLWNWMFGISVMIGNIVALTVTFDPQDRSQAILGNPTYIAVYVFFNILFALILAYRTWRQRFESAAIKYSWILYYGLSTLLFAYVIFKTQTRGTGLALILSSALFLVILIITHWKNRVVRFVSLALLTLGILTAGLFWLNRDAAFIQNSPLLARIANISASEGTGRARIVNWGIALDAVRENPVMGWGQENYTYAFAQKFDPEMYKQEPWFDRTHNVFLDWSVQGGIPAVLLYIAVFVAAILTVWKSTSLTRVEKNLLITFLFGYTIHNLFVFDNYSSYLLFFLLMAFLVHHTQKDRIEIDWDDRVRQAIAILLIILVCVLSWFTIIKPHSVARGLISSLTERDANKVLGAYRSMLAKNSFGDTEATIRLLGEYSKFMSVKDEAFQKSYLELANEAGRNMTEGIDDVRRIETYGGFLLQSGDVAGATKVLERARELAPNRQSNLYALGFAYASVPDYEKAKEVLKHAYEILPENVTARTNYGGILLLAGDPAGKNLIEGYSYKDPFFISVFTQAKMYKEVIQIREQLAKDNPKDQQNVFLLALAYTQEGQKAKAIALIQQLQKEVPEFKAQGDLIIQDIRAGRKM